MAILEVASAAALQLVAMCPLLGFHKFLGGGSLRGFSRWGFSISMIAAFMLIFSVAALLQFFLSYCRSILATYAKVELSAKTREVACLDSGRIPSGDFARLLGLLRLARDPGDDRMELFTIRVYYSIVRMIGAIATPFTSMAKIWSENEGARCAYFAAVALDRRIASLTH